MCLYEKIYFSNCYEQQWAQDLVISFDMFEFYEFIRKLSKLKKKTAS